MTTSLSPSQQQSSSIQVAALANEIATLKILESTKKGRLKYENGWDKSPHSFYKLISDVQQQTEIPKARILERVYQITVREKQKHAIASRLDFDQELDHQSSSSCSSSALTLNEFYNSEYYESSSSSRSQSQNHSPIHQITIEKGRNQQQRRVRFSDFPDDDDDEEDEIDTTITTRRHSLSHITTKGLNNNNSNNNGTNTIIATKKSSLKPPTPKQQQRQQIKSSPIQSFAVNLNINNNHRSVKSSNLNTTLSPTITTSHSPSASSSPYNNNNNIIIIRRPQTKKNFGRFTSGNFRVLDDDDEDEEQEGEYEEEEDYEDEEDEEQQRIEEEEIEAQLLRRVGHTMPISISKSKKERVNDSHQITSSSSSLNKQQQMITNNNNSSNDNDDTKNQNVLGHILKRGYGIREDEYDDEADARLFFKDCEIYLKADQLLAECDNEYRAIAEERFQQRRRKYTIQKSKQEEIQREHQLVELKKLEVSRLEKEEKLLKIREEEKKELADFLAKRRIDKEKDDAIKAELEHERQILLQQYKKQEEEAVAAALAQVQKLEAEKVAIASAKLKAEQEAATKLENEKKFLEDVKLKTQQQQQQTPTSGIVTTISKKQGGYTVPSEFQGYIMSLDLQKYLKSQQLLSDHKDRFAYLSSKENKEFYFAALKAVNTPLNSLAKNLVQAKLDQLVQLLQGKPVYLGESTGTSFSAKVQPEGEVFISNLLAFRFVKKSESEISKGRDSVEPLARLGVALAQHFPQWAVLVRANLFQMCPFLVPFSFPQNNMSTQEYALAMGHKLEGSESAVLQALLDKMTGYCTLYGLMVKFWDQNKGSAPQQNPSGGDTEEDISEFFSLREVWRILVATIKLKPQVDMTATIVRILLETLGDRLWATYRYQFQKLMQVLITSCLPLIRNETPAGRQAAITRLEIFLENKLKTGFQ